MSLRAPTLRVAILLFAAAAGCCGPGGSPPATPADPPSSSDTWSIGNRCVRLVLRLDPAAGMRVGELRNLQTVRNWTSAATPDTLVTVDEATLPLGTSDRFRFTSAETSTDAGRTELRLV